jgi:hypothetical protein
MKFIVAAYENNMTPEQQAFEKSVQRAAYERLPETCDQVRSILDDAQNELMRELEVDPADNAIVDDILSRVFMRVRDEVTQKFRTEQMRLINEMVQKGQ